MDRALPPALPPARVLRFETIGSTNAEALRRARDGARGPLWLVAERQTAGRGRRGRTWASPPGNLYATLLVSDVCAPGAAAQLSFVAAVALRDALEAASVDLSQRLRFKWPNDVLLDGQKVAGILIEGETGKDGGFAAAIGIGVNCASHPSDAAFPATSLAASGSSVTAESIFAALSPALLARLAVWRGGDDFAGIRRDWLAHAAKLGEIITVRTPAEQVGVFEGIDEQGRLVLRDDGGNCSVYSAADVQFGYAGAHA